MKSLLGIFSKKENRNFKSWVILTIATVVFGLIATYASFIRPLGLGDPATFASFGCNISKGEVIYRDFYHFRTPGEYFVHGLFSKIFGCKITTLGLSSSFMSFVIFPVILIWSVYFLNRKISTAIISLFVAFAFPISATLRVGFGLLSVALFVEFIRTSRNFSKIRKNKFLISSGISMAATFFFGQDIAIISSFLIVCLTIFHLKKFGFSKREFFAKFFEIALKFALAAIAALSPFLLYLIINSAFVKALYYIFYYAILIQPNGMDLPFPEFSFKNAFFYFPIVMMAVAFVVALSQGKKKISPEFLAIFGFSVLRFVSAAGRSDAGHLFFSIFPDLVILSAMIFEVLKSEKTKISLREIVLGIGFFGATIFAVFVKSLLLLVIIAASFVVVFTFSKRDKSVDFRKSVLVFAIAIVSIFSWNIIFPEIFGAAKNLKRGIFNRQEIRAKGLSAQTLRVVDEIKKQNPKMIFSYAVHPYFYTLGVSHAAPFMTFEPQTTDAEQLETIENLRKNRPELVIFDPLQAYDLSGGTNKITEFILNNYETYKIDDSEEVIWFMEPRKNPRDFLAIGLSAKEFSRADSNLISVENNSKKIKFGLLQNGNSRTEISGFEKKYEILKFESILAEKSEIEIEFSDGATKKIEVKEGEKYEISEKSPISKIVLSNGAASQAVYNNFILEKK